MLTKVGPRTCITMLTEYEASWVTRQRSNVDQAFKGAERYTLSAAPDPRDFASVEKIMQHARVARSAYLSSMYKFHVSPNLIGVVLAAVSILSAVGLLHIWASAAQGTAAIASSSTVNSGAHLNGTQQFERSPRQARNADRWSDTQLTGTGSK